MGLGSRATQWLSVVLLLHSAYSTYEYLSQLKALEKPQDHIPFDVILEAVLSLVLFTLGTIFNAPPLVEITWESEMQKRTIDEMNSRLGFASFRHRGTRFFGSSQTSD